MKNCPVCQKVLSDQAKFCYFCGASLLNDEAPVEVPANEPEPETVEEAIEEPVVSAVEPEPVEAPVEPDPQPFAELFRCDGVLRIPRAECWSSTRAWRPHRKRICSFRASTNAGV